jgi:hypothetical protein
MQPELHLPVNTHLQHREATGIGSIGPRIARSEAPSPTVEMAPQQRARRVLTEAALQRGSLSLEPLRHNTSRRRHAPA